MTVLSDKKIVFTRRRVVIGAGVAVLATALLVWLQDWGGGEQTTFQGYIEGNFVYLAPESGGKIVTLLMQEGQEAASGVPAFALDSAVQTAQRDEAQAKLNQARAQLEDMRAAQQRPEQIAVLKAQEDQVKAQLELSRVELERQKALFQRGYTSKAALDQAQATYDKNSAALAEAQRQITAAELAGRSAAIEAAEASVRVTEAALKQAETLLEKRRVAIPTSGAIQEIFFRVGEVVNAGQPVISLLPPGNLKYRFYVPEPVFSKIRVGQLVAVTCDSCPDKLMARISYVSRDTEFTPPVIFSDEERAKLVFKVEALPMQQVNLPVGLPVKIHTGVTQDPE